MTSSSQAWKRPKSPSAGARSLISHLQPGQKIVPARQRGRVDKSRILNYDFLKQCRRASIFTDSYDIRDLKLKLSPGGVMMSHHWMKLAALAALLAVAASCKTLDEGSASGTTGLPAASIPAETGTANCAGWNTWKFFEAATLERVTECLRTGADPKARDQRGNTPLHKAAFRTENPAVIAALVKAGADPNERDKQGETPLHRAAWANKNPAVAAALLKAGADPNARNKKGRDASEYGGQIRKNSAAVALPC